MEPQEFSGNTFSEFASMLMASEQVAWDRVTGEPQPPEGVLS